MKMSSSFRNPSCEEEAQLIRRLGISAYYSKIAHLVIQVRIELLQARYFRNACVDDVKPYIDAARERWAKYKVMQLDQFTTEDIQGMVALEKKLLGLIRCLKNGSSTVQHHLCE